MQLTDIPRQQTFSSKTDSQNVPPEIRELAQKISDIHGPVKIVAEQNGIHIYFPSPYVVETDGRRDVERSYPHGTVNAEKFLGLGKFRSTRHNTDRTHCSGLCMKTQKPISLDALLAYPKIEERIGGPVNRKISEGCIDKDVHLVNDGKGNMIPRGPGKCTPITELPSDHPAVEYLFHRGFTNLEKLYEHSRVSFCDEEVPEDRATQVFYKKLANGFRDTPQGRLVFFADMFGVQVGWQARIMDMVRKDEPNKRYFWHPYDKLWVPMEIPGENGKWTLNPEYDDGWPWDKHYSRYKTAKAASRNGIILGFDAARRWNSQHGRDFNALTIVCEGPLTSGRLGSPSVATLGASLSENQVKFLAQNFHEIVYVPDRDAAGDKASISFANQFNGLGIKRAEVKNLPEVVNEEGEIVKDCGEMSEAQADSFLKEILAWNSFGLPQLRS